MQELIGKLLLAIDEAWLDYRAQFIHSDATATVDEKLESLLFDTESRILELNSTLVLNRKSSVPRAASRLDDFGDPVARRGG